MNLIKDPRALVREGASDLKAKAGSYLSGRLHRRQDQASGPKRQSDRVVLFVEDITVSFDGFKALNDLTFYLEEGELRCFIGPNGAGKTTMMDVLTGKTRPDEGTAFFRKEGDPQDPATMCNLLAMDEVAIATAGIGRKFQKPSVFETLTVGQNLELALASDKRVLPTFRARLNGEDRTFLEEILERIKLQSHVNDLAGKLSHGQKQWLEIGMLLMQKPRLIMLDEPVAGMTPEEIGMTIDLLHELEGHHTIMVVEHDMEFIRAIAHKVTVLNQGTVLAEGSMDEMQSHPQVVEAYLGKPMNED